MTTNQIADYFRTLTCDLEGTLQAKRRSDTTSIWISTSDAVDNNDTDDICILRLTEKSILKQANSSSFHPGLGEKPFSALTDDPFQLAVINLGEFTEELMTLEPGTEAYVRGPHGNAVGWRPAPKSWQLLEAPVWQRSTSWPGISGIPRYSSSAQCGATTLKKARCQ